MADAKRRKQRRATGFLSAVTVYEAVPYERYVTHQNGHSILDGLCTLVPLSCPV